MKKSVIIFSALLCGAYLLLGSNAAGPASAGNGIRNGGPGSNGTCGACHGGGSGTITASLSLKEKATGHDAAGSYKPGIVYTVTISGNNANLAFFGFQVTAARGNAQAGAFGNMGSDKHIANLAGLQVVEHSTSLAKTNNQYEASFDWTAPAAGTGTVTFYGIINGVNKDNNTTGDKVSNTVTLNLTEDGTNGIAEIGQWRNLKLAPVPATDVLKLSSDGIAPGNYELRVYDLNGRAVWNSAVIVRNAAFNIDLPVRDLPAGTYLLHITGKDGKVTRMFTKQ